MENDSGSNDTGRKRRGEGKVDDEEEGRATKDGESYEPCCKAPSSQQPAIVGGQVLGRVDVAAGKFFFRLIAGRLHS